MPLDDGKPYTPEERRAYYRNLPVAQRLDLEMQDRPVYPWLQYPGEPNWAFRHFQEYLSQGTFRTVEQTAEFRMVAITNIKNAFKKYRWAERAKAWDSHQLDMFRQKHEADILALNEKALALSRTTMDKVAHRIDKLDPDEIDVRHLAPLMKEAYTMGRLALGMSTENIEEKQEQKIEIFYTNDWNPNKQIATVEDEQELIDGEATVLELPEPAKEGEVNNDD